MGIRYDASARRWVVDNEKTDYKTDNKTDYDTSRRTDYETNLKTDYPIPDFLPTNLPIDLPTTLKTDYKTDYSTDNRRNETYWTEECSGWWIFRRCRDVQRERWVN